MRGINRKIELQSTIKVTNISSAPRDWLKCMKGLGNLPFQSVKEPLKAC